MVLKDRQKSILDAIISEYIKTAEPVASSQIVDKYRLSLSPATIRNEMFELDSLGYLKQPHTSAGRVPTDQALRLFVDQVFANEIFDSLPEKTFKEVARAEDEEDFIRLMTKTTARLSRGLAVARIDTDDLFYISGFTEVFGEPEFDDYAAREEFAKLVDGLEETVERMAGLDSSEEPLVFIGEENPVKEARKYSMLIASLETPFQKNSLLSIIGPKRMDYKQNISLLKELQNIF